MRKVFATTSPTAPDAAPVEFFSIALLFNINASPVPVTYNPLSAVFVDGITKVILFVPFGVIVSAVKIVFVDIEERFTTYETATKLLFKITLSW